jgi:hypothetical protein
VSATWTTEELAGYMRGQLAATADVLGLTDLLAYETAVAEVGLAIGSDAPWADSARLRLIARREAWRLAMSQAAGDHAYSEDGASYSRNQVYDHARQMYELAADEVNALAQTPGGGSGSNVAPGALTTHAVRVVW